MSDKDNADTTAEQQPTQSAEPLQVPTPPPSSDSGGIIRTHSEQPIKNKRTTVVTDSVTVKSESSNEKD